MPIHGHNLYIGLKNEYLVYNIRRCVRFHSNLIFFATRKKRATFVVGVAEA